MAIILGVNIPDNKRIENALTKIQGIGPTISKNILSSAGVIDNPRVHELAEEDLAKIRSAIDSLKLVRPYFLMLKVNLCLMKNYKF